MAGAGSEQGFITLDSSGMIEMIEGMFLSLTQPCKSIQKHNRSAKLIW